MQGGDASAQRIFNLISDTTYVLDLYRWTDNTIVLQGRDNVGAINLSMVSVATFTSGGSWKHIIATWDLASAFGQLYVNGSDSRAASPTLDNSNIDYAGGASETWTVGADGLDGSLKTNAYIADFYFNNEASTDLTVGANLAKFISGAAPVDLGASGSAPTGSSPRVCLNASTTAAWNTNNGTGGGFTVTGALTDAGSNPP